MRKTKSFICLLAVAASSLAFQSCDIDNDDDNLNLRYPSALVTVCPLTNGEFEMVLNDSTKLYPANMSTSPFGKKEVRALVNYSKAANPENDGRKFVNINWIDSIRTKYPEPYIDQTNAETYGNDPVEIMKSWITVAEDGYMTLRLRTVWGHSGTVHRISLLSGINPDNVYELELRHDANGDVTGELRDALIAFNLNLLPRDSEKPVKVKLHWNSFSGAKSAEFDLKLRPDIDDDENADLAPASLMK